MKKVAVTAESPELDARIDPRFGRAAGFLIIDPDTMAFNYVDNGRSQVMAQGAGIQAAEIVAASGAGVLLTGFVGPKAFRALNAAGIAVGPNMDDLTVREAIQRFRSGAVEIADAPNSRGNQR
ncbi:MAG: NifB/NifX family molybdenum-iron cluster-binding protein [Desulfobacterales bacterium]|nr:NifB/NifX family molybdenum-iron cluster-binding protein [Desulfobacterales bacterium]MDJ0990552.1 NifB/NifX family molybdenum-iron cluster-binding protein [Desulfobacterales bacterium]